MADDPQELEISRRDFLRAGAATVAGTALLSAHATDATTTAALSAASSPPLDPARKVRIGIVGGRFGAQFQWHEHPNCIVEAVSDLVPARCDHLAEVYKCGKKYPSLEEMIKDPKVEAVGVFTGAPDHLRHVKLCMEAGKHVLCAVPAAMSLEECDQLLEVVKRTGLTYMMAETSYYHQSVITARQWFKEGKFGRIYYSESEYFHPGLEELFFEDDGTTRSWRYGLPPMLYPTHCTGMIVGVTGEQFTSVVCTGWGDDSPILKDNAYKNPFWNETAMFHTDRGNSMRIGIWWRGPIGAGERGQWYGEKMSFYDPTINGQVAIVRRDPAAIEKDQDEAGYSRKIVKYEKFDQPDHWKTDMLPGPLRHPSAHDCSHPFITHEFIAAIIQGRRAAVDVYDSLAMTAPGIVAHQSALQDGAQLKIPQFTRPG
jgi:predicted dehydrogenase